MDIEDVCLAASDGVRRHAWQPKEGVQSNASVFPTMLCLAGIETRVRVDSLSLTNPRYRLGTRHYLNDHNNAVPLSIMALDKLQFTPLSLHIIFYFSLFKL